MISEELWKTDKISFQTCEGIYQYKYNTDQRIQEVLITYCVFDCLVHGYPQCKPAKNMMLQCLKTYGIQPIDNLSDRFI